MLGHEEHLWFGPDPNLPLGDRHWDDNRLAVLLQLRNQLAADLHRRRSVGGELLDAGQGQGEVADGGHAKSAVFEKALVGQHPF
jgi:hypothetical protein